MTKRRKAKKLSQHRKKKIELNRKDQKENKRCREEKKNGNF